MKRFYGAAFAAALFGVTFLIFSLLCLNGDEQIRAAGEDLAFLRAEIAASEAENGGLRREIAALTSPERLAAVAGNDLGMVRAGEDDFVTLTDGGADRDDGADEEEECPGGIFAAVARILP
ncbi:MAG: FtsB family cell division protein [Bacillota bacterium]|jgi:cell division protein FtsB